VLIFGFLIFVHELGHFLTARMFGIGVNEFAIGMGPKLFSKRSQKSGIVYSLRALPIGGFVSMVGEDEAVDDESSFRKKSAWKRLIVLSAGGITNMVVAVLLMVAYVLSVGSIGSTVVAQFEENALSATSGLQVDDVIISVDGQRVYTSTMLGYEIMRRGTEPVDIVVERGGKRIVLEKVSFGTEEYTGVEIGKLDFYVYREHKTFANISKHIFGESVLAVKQVWESLFDLIGGKYGIEQMSGPIGITEQIGSVAKTNKGGVLYLAALIAMNLGIFNLLPFPALDGGRILFCFIEMLRGGKPIRDDIEAKIHLLGILILFGLMIVVTCKDIINIFL